MGAPGRLPASSVRVDPSTVNEAIDGFASSFVSDMENSGIFGKKK